MDVHSVSLVSVSVYACVSAASQNSTPVRNDSSLKQSKKMHRRLNDKIYKNFPRFEFSRIRFIDFDDTFSPPYPPPPPTKKQSIEQTKRNLSHQHCEPLPNLLYPISSKRTMWTLG